MTTQPTTVDQMCLNLLKDHQAFERERAENEQQLHQLWREDYALELEMLTEENDELDSENDDLRFELSEIQEHIRDLADLSLHLDID